MRVARGACASNLFYFYFGTWCLFGLFAQVAGESAPTMTTMMILMIMEMIDVCFSKGAAASTSTGPETARDLARKVRALTQALGKERGRTAVLERERDQWREAFERASGEQQRQQQQPQGPRGSRSNAGGSLSGRSSARSAAGKTSARGSVASSSAAHPDAAAKVSELRAQLDIARAETASLTRVLERELGDGVTGACLFFFFFFFFFFCF
jgi:hypothetical protein